MSSEFAALQQQYDRLNLLYQVGQIIHSTLDPQEALELILREVVRLTRATSGSIVLFNPTSGLLEIQAAHGLTAEAARRRLRVGEGVTGWVARQGKPARVDDVTQDSRYVPFRDEVRSELAVPLEVRGEVHGVINVDSDVPAAFSASDQALLEALAEQASHVIQNTWLYEQARLKARLLESLVSVGQTINSALNVDEALQVITREACQLMRAKVCSLLLLDDSREWLDLRASHGASPEYVNKPRLSLGESLVGMVVRRKKPVQVEDVRNSALYQNVEVAQREGLVSLLSVPLLYRQQAIGALSIYTERPHSFSNEEIRILSALAELSAVAIEKARLYERIMTMEEELRQSERLSALGLLAAEVAHEIRNPLTVMKMLFHSLDLRYPETDPRARDASLMAEKMDHLNKTVERILDFARSVEPQWAPVNLNELIGDLGLLIRHKLKNQSIQLVPKLAADLPIIQADATQLEQAFLNLALNAVEAMPTGGNLSITTRALPRRGPTPTHVVVEFKDTGGGFSAAARQRVFGSLLATTKRTGTGLGLAIVNRVVETHLGKLRIRSREGHGAAFCVILPLSRVV